MHYGTLDSPFFLPRPKCLCGPLGHFLRCVLKWHGCVSKHLYFVPRGSPHNLRALSVISVGMYPVVMGPVWSLDHLYHITLGCGILKWYG